MPRGHVREPNCFMKHINKAAAHPLLPPPPFIATAGSLLAYLAGGAYHDISRAVLLFNYTLLS